MIHFIKNTLFLVYIIGSIINEYYKPNQNIMKKMTNFNQFCNMAPVLP